MPKDVPEPGLGEVHHLRSVQRTLVILHVNAEREGGDSRFSQKGGNISLELPLKCDYTLKSNIVTAPGGFISCQS